MCLASLTRVKASRPGPGRDVRGVAPRPLRSTVAVAPLDGIISSDVVIPGLVGEKRTAMVQLWPPLSALFEHPSCPATRENSRAPEPLTLAWPTFNVSPPLSVTVTDRVAD